jgi:hypothetical protein
MTGRRQEFFLLHQICNPLLSDPMGSREPFSGGKLSEHKANYLLEFSVEI